MSFELEYQLITTAFWKVLLCSLSMLLSWRSRTEQVSVITQQALQENLAASRIEVGKALQAELLKREVSPTSKGFTKLMWIVQDLHCAALRRLYITIRIDKHHTMRLAIEYP